MITIQTTDNKPRVPATDEKTVPREKSDKEESDCFRLALTPTKPIIIKIKAIACAIIGAVAIPKNNPNLCVSACQVCESNSPTPGRLPPEKPPPMGDIGTAGGIDWLCTLCRQGGGGGVND